MRLVLVRHGSFPDCIIGRLYLPEATLWTIERPWRNNMPEVSCIPCGNYDCDWFEDDVHGLVLRVLDVPNRSGIYFHAGNYVRDVRGCVAPGLGIAYAGEGLHVTESRSAMRALRALRLEAELVQLELEHIAAESFG